MKAPGKAGTSPALQGSNFSPTAGDAQEGTQQVPEQLRGRYLSRRCTPRRGSPRTRSSRWAPPQWCPSSCPAGSPCCSWRKAPAGKEPKRVNGANALLWQGLGFLQGYYCLHGMLDEECQMLTSSSHRTDTFCTIVLPQPTAVTFLWRNTSRDSKEDQQIFVISTVLWALQTGMWPWYTYP